MNSLSTINLMRTKTSAQPELDFAASIITRVIRIIVVIVIVAGLSVSGLFYYFATTKEALTRQQSGLSQSVTADKIKEGLLLVIKHRVETINKIITTQKDWGAGFDVVNTIVARSTLDSVSVNEESKIVVQFTANTIDEVISVIDTIKAQVEAKRIRDPELVTLTLDKNNKYAVGVRFSGLF